jgi:hypothetical protein
MTMQTQTAERARLYLEDLQPGQVHRSSGAPASVDADGIKAYARQFDPQPFHLDEVAAGQSLFHGLVASGWHTAAMTMRLLVGGELKPAGGIVGTGFDEFRWPSHGPARRRAPSRMRDPGSAAVKIPDRSGTHQVADDNAEPEQRACSDPGRQSSRSRRNRQERLRNQK